MNVVSTTRLVAEPIKPKIGARVLNSKEELLSGELAASLRELIERVGVLVFPQINFSDDEQVAFTRTLGNYAAENADGSVTKITLDVKENPAAAEYLKGSLYWHIDGTRNDVPIFASMLSCRVPSPKGTGHTGFCNTYAAYDDKLKGMQAVGEKELPLVWTHKSGRKSLVLGCTAHHVVNVDYAESARIIVGLREWATSEQFSFAHEWEVGDCVMWDNTGTMHRAEWYDPSCGRMMHRTKLEGEEAFE
jgi:alpha-ketoglutarate-dependent taurine dioxygenase